MKTNFPIGIGPGASGQCSILEKEQSGEAGLLDSSLKNGILICLTPAGRELLHKADYLEVAGLIVPSVHYRDLEQIAGSGVTVVVLKKYGEEELSDVEKGELRKLNGRKITISKNKDNTYEFSAHP